MAVSASRRVALCGLIAVTSILLSCSGTTSAIQPGTPAFYWAGAKETYAAGDYQKTIEHLGNILSTQNDYVARAAMDVGSHFRHGPRLYGFGRGV
jgi:hypothetical protein